MVPQLLTHTEREGVHLVATKDVLSESNGGVEGGHVEESGVEARVADAIVGDLEAVHHGGTRGKRNT